MIQGLFVFRNHVNTLLHHVVIHILGILFRLRKSFCCKVLDLLLPRFIFIMKNNTITNIIDELTYKQYAKMHLNPTSMIMKPK